MQMLPPATSADPPAAPGAVGGRSAPAAMHGPVPGFVLGGDSRKLESMLQSDRAEALLLLARFLCEEAAGRDAARREHAGLYLVQQLDEPVCTGAGGDGGKGQTASAAQSWLGVGAEQRGEIKGLLLGALGSSAPRVRNAAATAIARVGSIELEGGDEPFWPELLPTLAQRAESVPVGRDGEGEGGGGSGGGGAGTASATDGEAAGERESDAALLAIRRLCDRDDAKLEGVLHDAELVERLALAILSNVRPAREDGGAGGGGGEGEDEGEDPAATALVLVLVEAETLWSAPEPVRPEVARALVLAAVCPSVPGHVRRKAFTVLGACADWLEGSHVDALWRATAPCVHADADAETAGLGAMSFWCDLAEHEEDTEAADGGHIARHQAQLLPVILGAMLLQQEGVNDDDLTLSQCASLALRHVQAVVGCGRVLEVVAPFVRAGINEAGNWRKREAAAMALGVSVETGEDAAKALLAETLAALLQCADNDSHAVVQDSAIWALGSACKAQPGLMLAQLAPLMSAMERGLRDAATSSHIAERWCAVAVALAELAEGELALDAKAQLSPYVQQLCTALLVVCQRLDYPGAVLTGASEAIAAVVVNAAAKSIGFIEGPLFLMVNEWLASAVASVDRDLKGGDEGGPESGEKRHESHEAVASACGVVSSLASRLGSEEDGTPRVYLVVPKPAEGGGARGPADIKRAAIVPPPEWKHWTVTVGLQRRALEQPHTVAHEEALLALGAIATALGRQFERFAEQVAHSLARSLNSKDPMVVKSAVGALGDVLRALSSGAARYCDVFVTLLVQRLQDESLDSMAKPPLIGCFGDIALALGTKFGKYMNVCVSILRVATESEMSEGVEGDDDKGAAAKTIKRQLWNAILEALQGIVIGFVQQEPSTAPLESFQPAQYMRFLERATNDHYIGKDAGICVQALAVVADVLRAPAARAALTAVLPEHSGWMHAAKLVVESGENFCEHDGTLSYACQAIANAGTAI